MPIIKVSCEHCGKNHTCTGAVINPDIKEIYIFKKSRAERKKIKIEQSKPIIKMEKMEFNVMS